MMDVGERIVSEILENPGIPITQVGYVVKSIIYMINAGTVDNFNVGNELGNVGEIKELGRKWGGSFNSVTVANILNEIILKHLGNIQTAKPVMKVRGTRNENILKLYPNFREPLNPKAVTRIVKEYNAWAIEGDDRYAKKFNGMKIPAMNNFNMYNMIPDHPEYWVIFDKLGNINFDVERVKEKLGGSGKALLDNSITFRPEYEVSKPKGTKRKILFSILFAEYLHKNGRDKSILAQAYAAAALKGAVTKQSFYEALKDVAKANFEKNGYLSKYRNDLYSAGTLDEIRNLKKRIIKDGEPQEANLLDVWRGYFDNLQKAAHEEQIFNKARRNAAELSAKQAVSSDIDIDNFADEVAGEIIESAIGVTSPATEYYENPLTVNTFINKAIYSAIYSLIKDIYDVLLGVAVDKTGLVNKAKEHKAIYGIGQFLAPIIKNAVLYGAVEQIGTKTSEQASEFMKNILIYDTVKELKLFNYHVVPRVKAIDGKIKPELKASEETETSEYVGLPTTDEEVALPSSDIIGDDDAILGYIGDEELENPESGNESEIIELEVDDDVAAAIENGEVEAIEFQDLGEEEYTNAPEETPEEGEETEEFEI